MTSYEDAMARARAALPFVSEPSVWPGVHEEPTPDPTSAVAAEALLRDLLKDFPEASEPCRALCRLYLKLDRWEDAAAVAQLEPDLGIRLLLVGDLIAADRPQEALNALRTIQIAGADNDGWVQVEYLTGRALDLLGAEEEAIACYERVSLFRPEWVLQRITAYDREQGRWPQCRPRLQELKQILAPKLPRTLAEGLDALWKQVAGPQRFTRALAWAWNHADQRRWDREEWVRAAVWGARAQWLMREWWRWAPERADQLLALLDPPDLASIREARAEGRGCLLVSAHVGMPAVALEFMQESDVPYATVGFAGTERPDDRASEQRITITANPVAVARSVVQSLKRGVAVGWTIDSPVGEAIDLPVFGQPMRFVAAAPKFVRRHASASFWCEPLWRGDRIVLELKRLPRPIAEESDADFTQRWYADYLKNLERVVRGDPRNLLGEAGMWLAFSPVRRVGAARALDERAAAKAARLSMRAQ